MGWRGERGWHRHRRQRMVQEPGDIGTDTVVDRRVRQGPGLDRAGPHGTGETQTEHLVAVAGAPSVVPHGLPGHERHRDAQRRGIRAEQAGAGPLQQRVVGDRPGHRRDGAHRITSPALNPATSAST